MKIFLAVMLLASAAFAQNVALGGHGPGAGPMSRGNFLKPEQYATQGAMTLYVDPTGNDGNTCTASGTSACLTIQSAFNRIPYLVNHQVTVNIAAGSYAGALLYHHAFAPTDTTTGAGISILGPAQANTTPATGTATGTVTSVTTDTNGFYVVSDNTQTWTVNDSNIQGRFLTLTGGTGSGQICPIFANTATSVSVSCFFSPAPVAGTTYAITTPSASITSLVAAPASAATASGGGTGLLFSDITVPRGVTGFVVVQDVGVSIAGRNVTILDAAEVRFNRVRLAATSTANPLALSGKTFVSFVSSIATAATGAAIISLNGSVTSTAPFFTATNSYITNAGTSDTAAAITMAGNSGEFRVVTSQVTTTSSTGYAVDLAAGANRFSSSTSRISCITAAAGNFGVNAAWNAASGTSALEQNIQLTGSEVTQCGTGLRVHGNNTAEVRSTTTFLSNTNAVVALGGGRILFSSVPAFTTNTTDITVDATTSTRAAFVALVPNSIVDLNYLSAVYNQP